VLAWVKGSKFLVQLKWNEIWKNKKGRGVPRGTIMREVMKGLRNYSIGFGNFILMGS